jgi:hypothetical protein
MSVFAQLVLVFATLNCRFLQQYPLLLSVFATKLLHFCNECRFLQHRFYGKGAI